MDNQIKSEFNFKLIKKLFSLIVFSVALLSQSHLYANSSKKMSYSFFSEGGQTENVFIIDGRNFPVKIGSVGLKASFNPNPSTDIYGKVGFGYSQKQSVSAFAFNLSGSVFATSFGGGVKKKYPIGTSNFILQPFSELNVFNYSSDTFRGNRDDDLLKANVKGNSTFLRGGVEIQYLTQNGYFFFGGGLNNWDIENEIAIKTGDLTITPRVWADNLDTFFQTGVVFDTGNSDAVIGMRLSDLTFDINTQLVELFAEVQITFGSKDRN